MRHLGLHFLFLNLYSYLKTFLECGDSHRAAFAAAADSGHWDLLMRLALQRPDIAFAWRRLDPIERIPISLLDLSCRVGLPKLTALLLDLGAEPDAPDAVGNTPLHQLSARAHRSADLDRPFAYFRCAAALASHGARMDAPNAEGLTPAALCARARFRWISMQEPQKAAAHHALLMELGALGADFFSGHPGFRASDYLEAASLFRAVSRSEALALSSSFSSAGFPRGSTLRL